MNLISSSKSKVARARQAALAIVSSTYGETRGRVFARALTGAAEIANQNELQSRLVAAPIGPRELLQRETMLAPVSVARVFLKKRKECGAHRQGSRNMARAALRFARVPQKHRARVAGPRGKELAGVRSPFRDLLQIRFCKLLKTRDEIACSLEAGRDRRGPPMEEKQCSRRGASRFSAAMPPPAAWNPYVQMLKAGLVDTQLQNG